MPTATESDKTSHVLSQERGDFSGWLMYHSVGVFPGQKEAISEVLVRFASDWCAPNDRRWDTALGARSALLSRWANLIGVDSAHVFAASSVTDAFARFVDGLGERTLNGRKVLVAADCFPSLHFLLSGLADRYDFTLVTVPLREGEAYVRDDDFIACWGTDVALAVVTWVSSLTSKRADLNALSAHARSVGSLVAVDLTQGAGIIPFDVRASNCDFACSTSLKWLCGVPGAGLGYVAPALLNGGGMTPAVRGWFSQEDPFNWDIERFSYAPDARRFDTGTPSVLPFIASAPGFDWVMGQPPGALRNQNLELCHRIIEIVDEKGYRLVSPRDDTQRGGSVMADVPSHLDVQHVVKTLAAHQIVVDSRGRSLRLSPGFSTSDDGIERLALALPK